MLVRAKMMLGALYKSENLSLIPRMIYKRYTHICNNDALEKLRQETCLGL